VSACNSIAPRKHDVEAAEARPRAVQVNPDLVPAVLKTLRRWVSWKWHRRRNSKGRWRWTKPPVNPRTGRLASPTNPATWGTFDEAMAYLEAHPDKVDGVGFVLGDGWAGVDLDDSRNVTTGELTPGARRILRDLDSYAEVSPSETGTKALLRGRVPEGPHQGEAWGTRVEMYSAGRYFCVTGRPVDGCPPSVEDRQAQLEALQRRVVEEAGQERERGQARHRNRRAQPAAGRAVDLDDEALLAKARAAANGELFRRLYDRGDASGYESPSEADQALCNLLAFWAGDDPEHIDRLFRGSALSRGKWTDREDYRRRTINKSLGGRTEFYHPSGPKAGGNGHAGAANGHGDGTPAGRPRGEPRRPGPLAAAEDKAEEPPLGVAIILDFLRRRYRPVFRRGSSIHCEDGTDVPMQVGCGVPDSQLIAALEGAADAPRFKGGAVNRNALPAFFKTWSRVAWGDLLLSLPDEDAAALADDAPACEEFRRLVREAMLSEVVLGDVIGKAGVTQTERRSLIGWCQRFAQPGPWRSIRSKRCWCRLRDLGGGEVRLQVAVRHEVFSQMHADRRLSVMGVNTFTRRAVRYKVGTSTRAERPHGWSAVVLHEEFIADLVATLPSDDEPAEPPEGGSSARAHDRDTARGAKPNSQKP
jgi:hypothetical protein